MAKPDSTADLDPHSLTVTTLTMTCLGAVLSVVVALIGGGLDVLVLGPLLVGLIVVMTRLWIGPPLLLLVVLLVLMWRHPLTSNYLYGRGIRTGPASLDALQEVNWLFDPLLACGLLIFTTCHYRLLSLTRYLLPIDTRTPGRPRPGMVSTRPHVRVPESVGPTELSGVVLTALLFTSLAMTAAYILHEVDNLFWPLRTKVWQAIIILWIASLLVALARALIGYLRLRQASPQESLQYLQDQLWIATYRDQGRLARWLTWARLRFQRRRKASEHTNPMR
jgi:hypothetical protein